MKLDVSSSTGLARPVSSARLAGIDVVYSTTLVVHNRHTTITGHAREPCSMYRWLNTSFETQDCPHMHVSASSFSAVVLGRLC